MTIDERLERLTERHEALTQTVELIAAIQMKNDERMGHLAETVGHLSESTDHLTERMAQLTETMNRLGNIVISHEERLDDLEGH
jgi:ABC-type transporter Mla subunit MlaD